MNVTDLILPETFCHSTKIFKWMKENVGFKKVHWNSRITVCKIDGARQMQFDIYDDGAKAIFKLTFGEHFTKMQLDKYFSHFAIPRYEQTRLLRLHTE